MNGASILNRKIRVEYSRSSDKKSQKCYECGRVYNSPFINYNHFYFFII